MFVSVRIYVQFSARCVFVCASVYFEEIEEEKEEKKGGYVILLIDIFGK